MADESTSTAAASAAAAAPAAAPAARTDPSSLFAPGAAPPLQSHEHWRATMAASLIDAGKWTREQAQAELAGKTSTAPVDAPAHNAQPDGQAADAASAPTSYSEADALIRGQEVSNVLTDPEVAGFHRQEAKLWGDALARSLANPATNEQRAATQAQTMRGLEAAYPGQVDTIVETARDEMRHLAATVPTFKHLERDLAISGAGNDLTLILALARRGAERAAKNITRGSKRP